MSMLRTEAANFQNNMGMNVKILKTVLLALISASLLFSCRSGSGPEPVVESEVTIGGLTVDKWVYFSIKTGETVGTSTFLSETEDAEWSARRDWDFAICGDYLKTNSGSSGEGRGGILRDGTHNFQTLTEAPSEGYLTDTESVVR